MKVTTDNLLELMTERFSCRSYDTDRRPTHQEIATVLESARIAPSACNRQPWQFLVVEDEKGRDAVIKSYSREWIKTAPTFIIAFGDHDTAWHRPADGKDHTDVDIAIAVEHITLAATASGMATCWVCHFEPQIIREAFIVPANLEPIAIIPIGFAAPDTLIPTKSRKSADEIIKWGNF